MKYFPLTKDRFEHQLGVRALGPMESIVEATDHYAEEIRLRRDAVQRDRDYYFQSVNDSDASQREALELICHSAAFLADGINAKTNEAIDQNHHDPLLEIARHVQEDLAILSGDARRGFPLIAGVIVFPSGWCIGDKLGKSLLAIHDPVPEFETVLNPATEQLMSRLKRERPVWRMNWGVRPSGQLDQSPRHAKFIADCRDRITQQNAGQECYFRVERQTLSRLPGDDILFAIHTHQSPLKNLSQDQRGRLLGVLQTCPEATLRYKGIWPMRDAVIRYLQQSLQ